MTSVSSIREIFLHEKDIARLRGGWIFLGYGEIRFNFAILYPSDAEPFDPGALKMVSACGGRTMGEAVHTMAFRAICDGAVGSQSDGFITEKVLDMCAEVGVPQVGRSVCSSEGEGGGTPRGQSCSSGSGER